MRKETLLTRQNVDKKSTLRKESDGMNLGFESLSGLKFWYYPLAP